MQEERKKKGRQIIKAKRYGWAGGFRGWEHVVRRLGLRQGLEGRRWVLLKELDFIW